MAVTKPPTQQQPLSLGISPCPNDTFAFHALVHGLVPGVPAMTTSYADIDVLNQRAAAAELDVVKVSYGALPWLLEEYALLPSGGALGRGCGPLVLTRPGDEGIDLAGATVAVPGLRTTAYLLLRLFAAKVAAVQVVPFEQVMPAVRDGRADAGLVIHESRFTYPSFGLVQHVDLGDWWEGETGLPIPLGAILARRSLPDLDGIGRAVRASVEAAWADPSASAGYVAAHAQEMDPAVQAQHIGLYVNEFTADLGDEGYAATRELLSRATTAGLVPAVPAGAI